MSAKVLDKLNFDLCSIYKIQSMSIAVTADHSFGQI